jgi:hypothetical protein
MLEESEEDSPKNFLCNLWRGWSIAGLLVGHWLPPQQLSRRNSKRPGVGSFDLAFLLTLKVREKHV